jgi:regulatory protein
VFKKTWKRKETSPDEEPAEIKDVAKAREKTMNRAMNLLGFKARSVAEMRERLLEKDWTNAEIVESVLDTLKEYNYLNDNDFAEQFAASNLRMKPLGKRRLQQKLALKKLDKETVETALEKVFEETPEEDLLERALEKRLRTKGTPKDRDETKKLFDYLLRQGFSFDIVRERLRNIAKEDFDESE